MATAYILARGPLRRALEDAARRGARVVVRIEGQPIDDTRGFMRRVNAGAVRELQHSGADAKLVHDTGSAQPPMHMKAVVCDGVAYLDDRNFTASGNETVLRDDCRAHVDAVLAAAAGKPHRLLRSFWTTKTQAVLAERKLLESAVPGSSVDVETESFSCNGGVYADLKRLAREGVQCRLVVSRKELGATGRHAAELLERAGVLVRAAGFNGKVAIVDGKSAWSSSANATSTYYNADEIDWAVRTRDKHVVAALRSQFEAHWRAAKPLPPASSS